MNPATTVGASSQSWTPAQGELAPGMLLDGRFEILELVARSYQATILKARDRRSDSLVAIKAPLMSVESDLAGYERFQREEKIGEGLDHPLLLKYIPVADKSRPYLVMEYLEGTTLHTVMERMGPMPQEEIVRIVGLACDALDYLHRRDIAHRDVKPENFIFCPDGGFRLIDFGLACTAKARRLTFAKLTSVMGTPDYIAPERAEGKRGDARSDIYSLGAILYHMATGVPPFEGENPFVVMNARLIGDPLPPRARRPEISAPLQEIILHAMERDPNRRYASVVELKRELENFRLVETTDRHLHLREASPARMSLRWLWPFFFGLLPLAIFLGMYLHFHHNR